MPALTTPEYISLLQFYRRCLDDHGLASRFHARKIVYDTLRSTIPDDWEARNTRPIKLDLDEVEEAWAGRDTRDDWLKGI